MLDLLKAYRFAYLIRHTEEQIAAHYPEGKMKTPCHLSIGQETAAVGVCMALTSEDRIYSAHRSHAHYLAKGGNLNAMIAEIYGKATGCAGGVGGSMHLVDEAVHMMGTSAIVGSSISVAVGSALAAKLSGASWRTVVFFGDSGPETGQFYEALNFAALHSLPILFVCENNGYATQTPLAARQPVRDMGMVALSMGLQGTAKTNDDVEHVYESAMPLLAKLPAYMEIATYRYREHVGPNYDYDLGYRTKAEVDDAMALDPVKRLAGNLPITARAMLGDTIREQVAAAFQFAEQSAWPKVTA